MPIKLIEVTETTYKLLEKIAEHFNTRISPLKDGSKVFPDAEAGLQGLIGYVCATDEGVRKVVYPDEYCQICGNRIRSTHEQAQRACDSCFCEEMMVIYRELQDIYGEIQETEDPGP